MKKIIIIIFIIVMIYNINISNNNITIPEESIRFRIIANSNSNNDQIEKMLILSEIYPILTNKMYTNIESIRNNINDIEENIKPILDTYHTEYNINYGLNYFPQKTYKGITYESGEYESLVVELGESKGDNWWCVLYPPLCLLEEESDKLEETEYKFFVKEILNNL